MTFPAVENGDLAAMDSHRKERVTVHREPFQDGSDIVDPMVLTWFLAYFVHFAVDRLVTL
jgi:hypothetical protein